MLSQAGDAPLRIYSSLPETDQAQPEEVARSGADQVLPPTVSKRTRDVERAITLALEEADGKAGDFDVEYTALDASDASGASPDALIQANARRAAADDRTAVYIGDFTSGASQQSIPILSRAHVAQISPASTRVGLTREDALTDLDEPGRYYRDGVRNFVRIVPPDTVQARALVAVMKDDDCTRVAMIHDGSPYGRALADEIRAANHGRVRFAFSQAVAPYGRFGRLVIRASRARPRPNCFVYSGSRNPNTVQIFKAFADALPGAKLYGTDGQVTASFYDPSESGLPARLEGRVKVMVPPRSLDRYTKFEDAFARRFGDDHPDPYAVYGYEAMRLALDAISRSRTGKRADIVTALTSTLEQVRSAIGPYSIDRGDTDEQDYGVATISDGRLNPPAHAPTLRSVDRSAHTMRARAQSRSQAVSASLGA